MDNVVVAQLANDDGAYRFLGVAKNAASMDAWIRATWGNVVPTTVNKDGTGPIIAYEVLSAIGEHLWFTIFITTEEVR